MQWDYRLARQLMARGKLFAMISVHSEVPWPDSILQFTYDGCDLQLVPPTRKGQGEFNDTYPLAVAEGMDRPEAAGKVQIGRRFLNALAWREQRAILEVGHEVTSWAMRQAIQILGNSTTASFSTSDLSIPDSREARLALAFYREGLSVRHTGFQFLSFFKIFNILHKHGRQQKDWINARLDDVQGHHV